MAKTLDELIVEAAMEWTRYSDLARRSGMGTDGEIADKCSAKLRGLCRRKRAEGRKASIIQPVQEEAA